MPDLTPTLSPTPTGAAVRLKVVPGASRDAIAGVLGNRLKVRVSAPAEGGKANKALCRLLAKATGLSRRDVAVVAGPGTPRKTVALAGISTAQAARRLAEAAGA